MLYCPVLKDGRIFTCATAAYIHLLNRAFGKELPLDRGIDLGAENLTGREVLAWLDKPVELCRHCALEKKTVAWRNGAPESGDWFG